MQPTAWKRFLFLLPLGLLLFPLVRFFILFPWSPERLVATDQLQPCEIIVVLGGEYHERIDHAFELIRLGYSYQLFTPNVGYAKTRSRILQQLSENHGIEWFEESSDASSTFEEAILTRRFIRSRNITTMILVTSAYHSYRARWIFQKAMPEITIISAPTEPDFDNPQSKIYRYFRQEQIKFAAYYFFHSPLLWFDRY